MAKGIKLPKGIHTVLTKLKETDGRFMVKKGGRHWPAIMTLDSYGVLDWKYDESSNPTSKDKEVWVRVSYPLHEPSHLVPTSVERLY